MCELKGFFSKFLFCWLIAFSAFGKPLSQSIYEAEKNVSCDLSSASEIAALKSICTFRGGTSPFQNLDERYVKMLWMADQLAAIS